MELHQELEKEQNLDYYYNEEEEEEEDEKNPGEDGADTDKINKEAKDKQEEDKKEEKKSEEENNNINNINNDDNNIINNNNNIINDNNMINDNVNNNKINEGDKNEKEDIKENKETIIDNNTQNEYIQISENSVNTNPKQQIIEEIDTTVPKKNNKQMENPPKEGNLIIQSISPNAICHRLIPKGSDLDISQKGSFQCYKIKTKSNLISFITGSKKIKVPYIIFIDENYYYMAKDKIVNPKKPSLRRIGNRYDLFKLSNFQAVKKGNDYEFAFEFVN